MADTPQPAIIPISYFISVGAPNTSYHYIPPHALLDPKQARSHYIFMEMLRWNSKDSLEKALIEKSACWKPDGTCVTKIYSFPSSSLRKWCGKSMCSQFEMVIGFYVSCKVPLVSSNTGMHGIPTSGSMKRQTCLENNTSIMTSASATYFASVVGNITHFCVLENQDTEAPPLITSRLETDVLSVALLA